MAYIVKLFDATRNSDIDIDTKNVLDCSAHECWANVRRRMMASHWVPEARGFQFASDNFWTARAQNDVSLM